MSKTITPNIRQKQTGKHIYHDVEELVQRLRAGPMTQAQIMQVQNPHETNCVWEHGNFANLIAYLGNHYPIYKYGYKLYKILTDEDIDKYREELRNEHRQRRNDLEKNATKYY